MMFAVSLRVALLCLMLPHVWFVIGSLDDDAAPPEDGYAFNYDHISQTNKYSYEKIQKMVESRCSKLVEDACIRCSEETRKNCGSETGEISPPVLPQLREKDDKICDSVVFLHLIKGIAEAFTEEQTEQVVMTLDSYRIEKLHKFLRDDSGDIPSIDVVYMVTSSLSPLSNTAHAPYSSSWFERTFSVSFIKAAVCLVILVSFAIFLKILLTRNISYMRLICTLVVAVLIINFAWSYMLLYKKKISERMAYDAQRKEFEEVCHSQIHLTAFQKMKTFFGFHLPKDERCQKFIESYQIDPFLEVHPIEAITDTFERIITSVSGAFGKSLGNFNHNFFSNVSCVYWIPAMVFNLLLIAVILPLYLNCGRRQKTVPEVRENQGPKGRDYDGIEEEYRAGTESGRECYINQSNVVKRCTS
ncbi:Chloride channel CLIC-like protein 1 [Holothuria leucospilota]|uniref:Chloride channel CLIC-like protein 1 n=1 Tax=Holothuria leucospilota TaxID=206669 RepID=A0A9Q1CA86_HOLLE|nr:Chloride channel CLIC-like protein 1 [Holothuria leucospilota]